MKSRLAVLMILAVAASACAESPTVSDGVLKVTTGASELKLANLSAAPLHYIVIERGTVALVDWIPCTGGPPCPTLAAGGSVSVPYSTILGYTPAAKEGVVYWWRDVTNGSGVVSADSLHNLVASLRSRAWPGVTGL